MAIRGCIELVSPTLIEGWCYDDDHPGMSLDVVLVIDGDELARRRSDCYRPDLAESGYATGHHAFQFEGHWFGVSAAAPAIEIRVISSDGSPSIALPHLTPVSGTPSSESVVAPSVGGLRRLPKIQLHIGLEKAGSSSLQRFLLINRATLAERGIWVSTSLAPQNGRDLLNHSALVAYALDISKESDEIRRLHGCQSAAAILAFRERVVQQLAEEIAQAPITAHTLVLSNEHLHSRLRLDSEIERLRLLLAPLCDQVEIVVYLRPQHRIAVSALTTLVKNGGLQHHPFPLIDPEAPWTETELMSYYDYDDLMRRWESVWGAGSVHPIILDQPIEREFLERHSLRAEDFTPLEERVNVGLSAAGLSLLRELNEELRHRPWAEAYEIREALFPTFEQHMAGFGAVGLVAEARAFQARFENSNERLRQRYFPTRQQLFEEDWSPYLADGASTGVPGGATAAVLRQLIRICLARFDGRPLPTSRASATTSDRSPPTGD